MKSRVAPRGQVQYPNSGSDIASGDVVPLTNRLGIAVGDIPQNKTGVLDIEGHFELPKQSGVALALDAKVYWDNAGQEADDDNGNQFAGLCAKAALAGDATVVVDLNVGAQS